MCPAQRQRNRASEAGISALSCVVPSAFGVLEVDQSLLEILVLAFVAGFVLFRLYTTLGRRSSDDPRPQPAQGELLRETALNERTTPASIGAASDGVGAILRADPSFDADHFLLGARAAYELIVGAYAKGDAEVLRGLVTPKVFDSYASAIEQRAATGGEGPELVRLRNAELIDAELRGDIARVTVKFEAELAHGDHGLRDARERWTFERSVRSPDPNWRLARVAAA